MDPNPWVTYTATLTGLVVGVGGSAETKWRREGDLICVRYRFVVGTYASMTQPRFSLPVTSAPIPHGFAIAGVGSIKNSAEIRPAFTTMPNTTLAQINYMSPAGGFLTDPSISGNKPAAWAVGDVLAGELSYIPAPTGDTVWVVSDTHFEVPQVNYPQGRMGLVAADVASMTELGPVVAWCHAGDQTTYGTDAAFEAFTAWWAGMGMSPSVLVPGNHDLTAEISPDQWAAKVGAPAASSVLDVGTNLRIVALAPCDDEFAEYRLTLDAPRLAWLDAALTTERDCLILFHAPLKDTVNPGANAPPHSSSSPGIYVHDDPVGGLATVLAAHPNVRAWVSGHTHTTMTTPGLVVPVQFGPTRLAAVTASSPVADGCYSARITVAPDRVEVRYRDHGARRWLAPVHTIALGG